MSGRRSRKKSSGGSTRLSVSYYVLMEAFRALGKKIAQFTEIFHSLYYASIVLFLVFFLHEGYNFLFVVYCRQV